MIFSNFPVDIYLLKFNNIKRSIVDFEHISHIFSGASTVDVDQLNVCWVRVLNKQQIMLFQTKRELNPTGHVFFVKKRSHNISKNL